METRVAVLAIIVRGGSSVQPLNELLHQYGQYIIGRMGVPYRERGLSIIALLVDGKQADADKIAEAIRTAGPNLVGVKVITLGGFLFIGGTLDDSRKAELLGWVDEMVAACR